MISEVTELDDLRALVRLFAAIWERPDEPPVDSDVLMALVLSGNYVSGAREDGRLVGGLIGWLGGPPSDHLHLHSHILGVVPDSQVRGLGFELKQHQRTWCLDRDVKVIEWTFDPLVRRNAYFNLNKLGADAGAYLVNVYGEMADGINAGEESDRILIAWRLDSPKAVAAAAGRPTEPSADDLQAQSAGALLSIGEGGEPVPGSSTARVVMCEVPDDIVAMRRSNPQLARAWRTAMRNALTSAFNAGYRITGVTRTGWYILERG
ncbi:MAG TPA: GNAT family N-acetyltransferase [Candidatus Dormibacteraeota bacterium]|nr:GNAT family N-acetyltransferase [Candidatus Dormibacteraeota bacterium]